MLNEVFSYRFTVYVKVHLGLDTSVSCWGQCDIDVVCQMAPHSQVHCNLSFQSAAYPWLRSTWEMAPAFTRTKDRQGKVAFLKKNCNYHTRAVGFLCNLKRGVIN